MTAGQAEDNGWNGSTPPQEGTHTRAAIDIRKQFITDKVKRMNNDDLLCFLQYHYMNIHSIMSGFEPRFAKHHEEIIEVVVDEIKNRMK